MNINSIKPSIEAVKLAKCVGGDFYIVGGFVRNSLLGRSCDDEDVCSKLTLSELEKALEGSEFSLKNKNKVLGTCKIVCENKSFDYACFRSEKYGRGHQPEEVEFVQDIQTDAKRRDFSINAIYYNLKNGELIDFFNGLEDLRKKRIKATSSEIIKDDGLRIFRMIRLAGEYNFSIEPQTFLTAQKHIDNVCDISKTKVIEQIKKLLQKTDNKAVKHALRLYNRLGIWKRVGLDVDHISPKMTLKCADKLTGFAIDVVDNKRPASVSYFLNQILSDYSGMSKKAISQFINIISGYYDALNHIKNKQYFFKYFDNFPEIYQILLKKSKILAQKYNFFYRYIISHKLVIRKSDLKISEKDLKKHFPSMPQKLYDQVLLEALSDVFDGKCQNHLDELLKSIRKKHFHNF